MKLTCLESSWIFVDIFGSLEFSTISRARFWLHSEYWQRLLWRETCRVGLLPLLLIPPYVRSWWSSWMRREISVFDWKSQPKPECGRRGWQRVEPPSRHCWTLEGLWGFLQPSGIGAFLHMGRAPISFHRGQESCSNSKFTSFQNLLISSPEKLMASFSYNELIAYCLWAYCNTWQSGPGGHFHDGVG